MAYTPALMAMPDRMALIEAGADECASGSQAFSGKMAASTPNPTMNNARITNSDIESTEATRSAMSAMFNVPNRPYTSAMAIRMSVEPTVPWTRYLNPASVPPLSRR